jgi:hypothetical protein
VLPSDLVADNDELSVTIADLGKDCGGQLGGEGRPTVNVAGSSQRGPSGPWEIMKRGSCAAMPGPCTHYRRHERTRSGSDEGVRQQPSRNDPLGGRLIGMARKLIIELPDGSGQMLEQVPAEHELQLQEKLKLHPELLPLEDLGLVGPAVVVGRESTLDSGRVDLVLLGNGGDLALVEFKTGPQNPDFRECLAQPLDYGSDLWG